MSGDSPFSDECRDSQDTDVDMKQRRRASVLVLTSTGGMRTDEARHVMIRMENAFEKRDLMRAFGRWRSVMLGLREKQLCATARDALYSSAPGAARSIGAVAAQRGQLKVDGRQLKAKGGCQDAIGRHPERCHQ